MGHVLVTIRPEAVVLDAAEGQVNTFQARVIAAKFRGSHIRIQLAAGSIDLETNVPVDDAKSHAVGSIVLVALPPEKLWAIPAD
jgi:ABC-type Fe3+/spermidine/putrescine transport system ATPase subunit